MAVHRRFTKIAIRPESDPDKYRKPIQIYVFNIYFIIIIIIIIIIIMFISLPFLTMEKFIYISIGSFSYDFNVCISWLYFRKKFF